MAISPFCLLPLMAWGFGSRCTWVGTVMPPFSASNSSRIFCMPSVLLPMYHTRGTTWIFSVSQVSFYSTSKTSLLTVLARVMMTSRYRIAISAVAFWSVIAVITPFPFLRAFMILMWAGACWWKSALMIADAITWSILMGGGTLSYLLEIRCLSAMLNRVVRAGPGPTEDFWLCVRGWTVSHVLSGIGVGLRVGLGLCRGSGCSMSCSLGLGLGFGYCCGWRFSGSPSCVAPVCCEATMPPLSCLAVSCLLSYLAPWAGAASHTLPFSSTSAVMAAMPIPHCTSSLWCSSHFVSLSSSHSFMASHCTSSRAWCASSIASILSIV